MKVFIETERLILREFTENDADLIIDLDSDPDVMKFLSDGKPTSPEVIRNKVIPDFVRFHQSYTDYGYWATIEKSTNQFIGWFLLRPAKDSSQGIELGYRFKKSAWGKGYATEGSRALLGKAFSIPGIKRVMAITMKANKNSWNVMEKLGMKFEKKYIEESFPGADQSAVQYVMTLEDFDSKRPVVLDELKKMEAIFHQPELGSSCAEYENMIGEDFWEVGASGRTYSRDQALSVLEKRSREIQPDIWKTTDFQCQQLGHDTYLLTYYLLQGERKTRRSTIWRRNQRSWKALYHQGTIVQD
jgi:RimJ/RimL family protein N-acetyltransferase